MRSGRRDGTIGFSLALWLGLTAPGLAPGQDPTPKADPPPAAAKPAAPPRATTEELLAKAGKPVGADDPMAKEVVAAHNKMRADAKLPPLAFAPLLALAAQVQASDMADHEEMRHEGSDNSTPNERIKRTGYKAQATGENVAVFYPDVAAVMQGWFDSPHHKANILGDFTELGVARVEGKDGKAYWCVDFGKPMPQLAEADAAADFVRLLNEARVAAKHPKLAASPALGRAAQGQAVASARDKGKGGTPTSFPLDARKYADLAMSTAVGAPTAEAVLTMFLANDDYKKRLLGPSTEVGVGYSLDADGTPYWCLILGKPRQR